GEPAARSLAAAERAPGPGAPEPQTARRGKEGDGSPAASTDEAPNRTARLSPVVGTPGSPDSSGCRGFSASGEPAGGRPSATPRLPPVRPTGLVPPLRLAPTGRAERPAPTRTIRAPPVPCLPVATQAPPPSAFPVRRHRSDRVPMAGRSGIRGVLPFGVVAPGIARRLSV